MFQDIEGLDLDDYRYNYVNLTGFRLVDPLDSYSKGVIEGMYYYEMDTRLKLLHNTNYNTIPVIYNEYRKSYTLISLEWLFRRKYENDIM